MKINPRYIIILCIVIFLAAAVYLYMFYSKQQTENTTAQQNLNNANSNYTSALKEKTNQEELLNQTTGQIAQLQSDLLLAQQKLQEGQQVIPESIENIDYDELLFDLAHSNGLVVLSVNVNGPNETQLSDVTMFVTQINISVRGATWDILNFINDITADTDFASATIDGVTMSVQTDEVEQEDGSTIEVTTTQGDFTLSLYGYEE
ncbi:MAG: hypothetical protein JW967_01375 [Dehalococcoidales bacterium]|nr:hypothetical protein [Dehalococcoidales bacterium]